MTLEGAEVEALELVVEDGGDGGEMEGRVDQCEEEKKKN